MEIDERKTRIWGTCRFCQSPLRHTFVDLGLSPLCESFVSAEQLNVHEAFYPLHVLVCDQCWLVQLLEYVSPKDIFSEYAYFSSYSQSWLQHARDYVAMIIERLELDAQDAVVEIASNDGYLLQYFVERGFSVLGVEPAVNVAAAAVKRGVSTRVGFFGVELARRLVAEGRQAKLLLGNNVLAHVPDLNDFVEGLKLLLAPDGTITMEFPHLLRLIEGNQFDTIYHEHFSYFSFVAVERVFKAHGLQIFDVEQLPTHGGSLRIYATHVQRESPRLSARVLELRKHELDLGFEELQTYRGFAQRVHTIKRDLLEFLIQAKRNGKSVAGYGAPGKGNTLLNYCGIREDFLDFTVDRNPYKHGKFLPGTRIPIFAPERLQAARPDYVMILPWNLRNEIMAQLEHVRTWGGRFVVPIPALAVL